MKKVFLKKILLSIVMLVCLVFLALWIYLVSDTGNRYVNKIYVSELLITVSKEKHNINYCKLLKEATKGNVSSVKQLTLLDFYDGVGYDHGAVIVDLINLIGEDKFIQSLGTLNEEQKSRIISYLMAGLEYGNNPNLQGKTLKEAFYEIYVFLN
jgi:hypothetical protein